MQVKDVMTETVDLITPTTTVLEASRIMRDDGVGALPVGHNDRLVGMVTDRDIVVRGVAEGRTTATMPVRDVMSAKMLYCFADDSIEDVSANMGRNQVRRLPVLNREKRLIGIVSLGDLAHAGSSNAAGTALESIARDGKGQKGI